MAQATTLVLTDRASTPVDHTFTPNGFSPNKEVAFFVESDGTPVGDNRFSVSLRKSATRRRASIKLAIPTVATQTVDGVSNPIVVRVAHVNVDFNFDVASTVQERKDAIGMIESALGASHALVNDTIVNLVPVF